MIASPSHSPSSVRSEIKKCDAVVLGLAPHVSNYDWLDEGFRLLAGEYDDEQAAEQGGKKNVRLIAAHVGKVYFPALFFFSFLRVANRSTPLYSRPRALNNLRLLAQYYRASDGHLSLGPGAFVQVLESASKSGPATVCGKPSKAFFEACLEGTRGAEVKDTESGKRTREERNIIVSLAVAAFSDRERH